jgi:hypothetical protein
MTAYCAFLHHSKIISRPKNGEGLGEFCGHLVHRTLELRLGHDPDERPEQVLVVLRVRPVGVPEFDNLVNLKGPNAQLKMSLGVLLCFLG